MVVCQSCVSFPSFWGGVLRFGYLFPVELYELYKLSCGISDVQSRLFVFNTNIHAILVGNNVYMILSRLFSGVAPRCGRGKSKAGSGFLYPL